MGFISLGKDWMPLLEAAAAATACPDHPGALGASSRFPPAVHDRDLAKPCPLTPPHLHSQEQRLDGTYSLVSCPQVLSYVPCLSHVPAAAWFVLPA